ncbi:MAG: tetratricopeptide repeat protein [Candidatus Omnitrophota bacterium]|nr:tetratricopeptide repeat protein [Candidatus Omnitrophota bacterium]
MKNFLFIMSMVMVLSSLTPAFSQTNLPQTELDTITSDIPTNWWDSGWDEIGDLKAFITKYPNKPSLCAKAQYYIGCYYYSIREYAKAIDSYRTLIDAYPTVTPECSKAQFEIAQVYLNCLDNPKQAITEYQKLIQNYPKNSTTPMAQLMIGRAYLKQKNMARAKVELQKVISNYPWAQRQSVEAYCDLGDVALQESKTKEAISYYKKAYSICPLSESNTLQWVMDKIYQGVRTLDGSLARANQFVKYQKYGPYGEDKLQGTKDDLQDPLAEF